MTNISINTKKRVEEAIIKYSVSKTACVLDLGCADLRAYSEYLISYFKNYTGVEYNPLFVNKVKQNPLTSNVNILEGNSENLQFKDNHFDLVVCNNMIAMTETKQTLKEILRVLKPGGILISLNNNTIEYSLFKMFRYKKIKEFIHSVVVIINTFTHRCFNFKIHNTTFLNEKFLRADLKPLMKDIIILHLDVSKNELSYNTINLIIRKNAD